MRPYPSYCLSRTSSLTATPLRFRAPQRTPDASLNHLVGGGQQRFRDGEAERLGGFEVDHHFVLGRRLHWKVGWLFALEDAIDVGRRTPVHVDDIRPIGNQAADGGE